MSINKLGYNPMQDVVESQQFHGVEYAEKEEQDRHEPFGAELKGMSKNHLTKLDDYIQGLINAKSKQMLQMDDANDFKNLQGYMEALHDIKNLIDHAKALK